MTRIAAILVGLFLIALAAGATGAATIGVQDVAQGDNNTKVISSYSVTAGSDLVLVVAIGAKDSVDDETVVSSVKYGTTDLTQAVRDAYRDSQTAASEIWYLVAPPTATPQDITVTFVDDEGLGSVLVGALVLSNVDQSNPVDAIASDDNGPDVGGVTEVTTITSLTDNAMLIDVFVGKTPAWTDNDYIPDTDGNYTETERWQYTGTTSTDGGIMAGSTRALGAAGTYTNTYTEGDGTSGRTSHALAAFRVVPEPATMVLLGLGGAGLLIRRKRS